ncbi:hypothetical protein KUTeg_007538 [Tegillarca granosa]|uniref:F-actin monooxygenase n=1 Tax=Tegillarca granosa TaxID=220873 RepID=A0ABQ9FI30_TEGGR|nr:hypothetical protein KUTeg_007538 [Tegillarca granosa]
MPVHVLVIGSGPCGLRTAIELAFLGAKVVIVEKRDSFSRNNVLHLWPYLITDLKNLGAKKFFGKFCAGAIDHIKTGWKCQVLPKDHPVSEYEFDVLVGADGKRNTLEGFKRKEFRGKLAIAITANFINRNTQAEARVEEISGVAFIFNQKFFKDLNAKSGIDLENIVYYKDDTHYFVMTAKKWSLLDRGVLKEDFADTAKLLHPQNISRDALQLYATDAANFSTNFQLPNLEFAINHYGQPDVAMFDFTSMFAALNASRVIEKHGHKLIVTLVGDSLLEPFWPTGSGCARGFLGAFDTAWMVRCWASGRMTPLQVIAQRESIYQLLSQTTPENLNRNYSEYTIDPNTRYPNLNLSAIKPEQVRHLYDSDDVHYVDEIVDIPVKRIRNDETIVDSYTILRWCQRLLNTGKFKNVQVQDLTFSWKNGMALCALIHCFKPELINLDELCPSDIAENNQLAFDIAQKELGISPVMTGQDMANCTAPDKLTMVSYLSCFFQKFRKERTPSDPVKVQERQKSHRSPHHRLSILQKLRVSTRFSRSKKNGDVHSAKQSKLPMDEIANKLTVSQGVEKGGKEELQTKVKVSEMAEILVSKFKTTVQAPAPTPTKKKPPGILLGAQPASEICFFCKKRVYLMERMNAEGVFFHRGCLKCDFCETGLRMNNYSCERTPMTGQVKFYCFRHNKPELRVTRVKRKRIFYEEDENSKENIPKIVIETGPGSNQSPEKRIDGSPKKKPCM